ncbi:hypothetical protein [Alphaspiravirus yamagawaense]|uniref:Uncharacterized protein n=1 Tax=Alphaspiravirus yamagawaense TaxID=1157339 RepID=J7QC57_9VIRU|nr:hypothetical protein [Aeropyrum coil-shaped virus]CCG27819.1 hypothetical protein [Aeropyrum coil-shaped virus]
MEHDVTIGESEVPVWESTLKGLAIPKVFNEQRTGNINFTGSGTQDIETFAPANGFAYVEGVYLNLQNPGTDAVTVDVVAVYDDATETVLASVNLSAGGAFEDWLRWAYDAKTNGKTVKQLKIRATAASSNSALNYTVRVTGTAL